MPYHIQVNDHSFEITSERAKSIDAVETSEGKLHLLHNSESYTAEITTEDFLHRKYLVKINNVSFNVTIHDELDQLIKKMGFETGANKLINAINAPMPGLILEINVDVGQTISKNDPLLILSAMKMENSFLSPRDGVIKAVHANVGDAVEKGQLLIEFE